MHRNLNEKYHESSNVISTLKSENSLLTFKLNEMSSNINDYSEKDNLINIMKYHLEKFKDEIRSLKSENYTLTSRLQNLDDISNDINILKTKNYELKNKNQDMLSKFSVLEGQT